MAFSATCKAGLVPHRMLRSGERILVAGDPGVTFTRDNLYSIVNTAGVAVAITDSVANGYLRCCKTKVCAAATVAFPASSAAIREYDDSADLDALISMEAMLPDQMIYAARFLATGGVDETVVSYDSATRGIALTTGLGADDRGNGALILVYDGAGKGEVNIQEDYDHTGGASELLQICHRPFKATLDTTSKLLILGNASDANAVGPGGTMDPHDSNDLSVSDGYDDGDWMVYPSWRDIIQLLPTGALPVIRRLSHE